MLSYPDIDRYYKFVQFPALLLRTSELSPLQKILIANLELVLFEMNAGEYGDTISTETIATHMNRHPDHILRELKKLAVIPLVQSFYEITFNRAHQNARSEVNITKLTKQTISLREPAEKEIDGFITHAERIIKSNYVFKNFSIRRLKSLTGVVDSNELMKGVVYAAHYINRKAQKEPVKNPIGYLRSCFTKAGRFKYDLINALKDNDTRYIPKAADPMIYCIERKYRDDLSHIETINNYRVHFFEESGYIAIMAITQAGRERIVWKILDKFNIPIVYVKMLNQISKLHRQSRLKITLAEVELEETGELPEDNGEVYDIEELKKEDAA